MDQDFSLTEKHAYLCHLASVALATHKKIIDSQEAKNDVQKDQLRKQLKKLEEAINQDRVEATTKWADLDFDEFDQVEVLLEVEEAFDSIIPDDVSDSIKSIHQAIEYFEKKELEKAAA